MRSGCSVCFIIINQYELIFPWNFSELEKMILISTVVILDYQFLKGKILIDWSGHKLLIGMNLLKEKFLLLRTIFIFI